MAKMFINKVKYMWYSTLKSVNRQLNARVSSINILIMLFHSISTLNTHDLTTDEQTHLSGACRRNPENIPLRYTRLHLLIWPTLYVKFCRSSSNGMAIRTGGQNYSPLLALPWKRCFNLIFFFNGNIVDLSWNFSPVLTTAICFRYLEHN